MIYPCLLSKREIEIKQGKYLRVFLVLKLLNKNLDTVNDTY